MANLGDHIAVGLIVDREAVDAELARHDFPRQNQMRIKARAVIFQYDSASNRPN
jgi:hypothetical protein